MRREGDEFYSPLTRKTYLAARQGHCANDFLECQMKNKNGWCANILLLILSWDFWYDKILYFPRWIGRNCATLRLTNVEWKKVLWNTKFPNVARISLFRVKTKFSYVKLSLSSTFRKSMVGFVKKDCIKICLLLFCAKIKIIFLFY